jgi:hypothetical protein
MMKFFRFAPDSSGQKHVFWHDGDAASVDGTQDAVFKELNLEWSNTD